MTTTDTTNADITRNTVKERKWPVWAGTTAEVCRLATEVTRQAQSRCRAMLADFDAETDRQLRAAEAIQMPEMPEFLKTSVAELTDERQRELLRFNARQNIAAQRKTDRVYLEDHFNVRAMLVDGDSTITGKPSAVLNVLDGRTATKVQFSIWYYYEKLMLSLSKADNAECGVKLEINSNDLDWANQAFTGLIYEIDKGQPKYAWIRKRSGRAIVACIAGVALGVMLALIVLPSVSQKYNWAVLAGAFISAIVFAGFASESRWLYNWLAPPFEIVSDGGQSLGQRRIAAIIAPVIAILIGVVVNRLYP